jgi:UDP-glucose 4-epimerase
LPGNAESPYGYTKQIGERIIRDFSKAQPWFRAVMLRYFNPTGAHPSRMLGELPIGVPNNLVPYITQTAIGKREKLTVFGNDYPTPDGTCIRDYIHVCDIAEAHVEALKKSVNIPVFPAVYNLGTGNGHTVLEVIGTFEKANGKKINYVIGPRRAGDVVSIYANAEKAWKELGWKARYTLHDMLKHAWEWENAYENFRN